MTVLSSLNRKYFCLVGSSVRGPVEPQSRTDVARSRWWCLCQTRLSCLNTLSTQHWPKGWLLIWHGKSKGLKEAEGPIACLHFYRQKTIENRKKTLKRLKRPSELMLKWNKTEKQSRRSHSRRGELFTLRFNIFIKGIQWLTRLLLWALCLNFTNGKAAGAHK